MVKNNKYDKYNDPRTYKIYEISSIKPEHIKSITKKIKFDHRTLGIYDYVIYMSHNKTYKVGFILNQPLTIKRIAQKYKIDITQVNPVNVDSFTSYIMNLIEHVDDTQNIMSSDMSLVTRNIYSASKLNIKQAVRQFEQATPKLLSLAKLGDITYSDVGNRLPLYVYSKNIRKFNKAFYKAAMKKQVDKTVVYVYGPKSFDKLEWLHNQLDIPELPATKNYIYETKVNLGMFNNYNYEDVLVVNNTNSKKKLSPKTFASITSNDRSVIGKRKPVVSDVIFIISNLEPHKYVHSLLDNKESDDDLPFDYVIHLNQYTDDTNVNVTNSSGETVDLNSIISKVIDSSGI